MLKFDLVAIGDITTDAFIRLKEASVHCDINRENCQICMAFGAKIPYESVTVVPAVGNAPNASVAAARLGLKSALVANLGADDHGKEALQALAAAGVDNSLINKHADRKTNYHYVLWYEDERTILVKHEEFSYALPDLVEPAWVYLSSMGASSEVFHETVADYLEAHPGIKLAFQPGTFQIKAGLQKMGRFYRRADIFFCNTDEATQILRIEMNDTNGIERIKKLLAGISTLGPKMVVITAGKSGAYARRDNENWFVPAYPDARPPLERTGAGDAFSSTVVAALALGEPLEKALLWGPINAMSVVQQIGAQAGLLDRQKLEEHLKNAPADYQLKQI